MSFLTLGLQGCFRENTPNSFFVHAENSQSASLELCLAACEGHHGDGGISACGFIAGVGCMGGDYDTLYDTTTRVSDGSCSSECPGGAKFGLSGACGNSSPGTRLFSIFSMGFGDLTIPSKVVPNVLSSAILDSISSVEAAPLGMTILSNF